MFSLQAVEASEFGLEVMFDGETEVYVYVSEAHKEKMCGLCGNYNGQIADEWIVGEECGDEGVGQVVSK